MKHRSLMAVGMAAALLGTAACGSSDNNEKAGNAAKEPSTITVWLQVDAQQSWPSAVEAATTAFKKKHPTTEVKVEYQQWTDHLTKLDAALAGKTPPDVVEMGNTEMTKYMAVGAFADLTAKKSMFDNSDAWLPGLAESTTFDGKTYGVPYYAGSRAVIYRKDYFKKAGITSAPTSLDDLKADADKLMAAYKDKPNFSAYWIPGRYWYSAMSWVKDNGGDIAVKSGDKWTGKLDQPAAAQAITDWANFVKKYSRADPTGDESQQPQTFAQGNSAMILANGWEWGVITDKKAGNPKLEGELGAFPMPSKKAGTFMPTFLGGSDLAVTAKSQAPGAAADWIAAFTGSDVMKTLATKGSVIPNNTNQASINANNPKLAPFAEAAKSSWFVPTAPKWADVEKATVLQDMLQSIVTGKKSVQEATTAANQQITDMLNS